MAEPQLDAKALTDMIDFSKLAKTSGIKELEFVEAGKAIAAQQEYTERLLNFLFEMVSENYIRWHGEGKYKALHQKHFPKGRKFYLDNIQKSQKMMDVMQNKVMGMMADMRKQAQAPAPAPAKAEEKPAEPEKVVATS